MIFFSSSDSLFTNSENWLGVIALDRRLLKSLYNASRATVHLPCGSKEVNACHRAK